ncbi:MAG: NAD(+) synthase [Clostridia bacterium]|nr:NAD(+) synthase [Clostridia bacterium]
MRDYEQELHDRVAFIRRLLAESGAKGIVFGNSGGKDCALVGILCKKACENTLGVIMPCASARNLGEDKTDAEALAEQYGIATRMVDLTAVKNALIAALGEGPLSGPADINIAPRLRMTTLYAIAAQEGMLVAGTGNRSEIYMGYFTKWGDGACDFNPIADLTATEVYAFLRYLGAPANILKKAPSAGLFEGQTDEADMGITYRAIDAFLLEGTANATDRAVLDRYHGVSGHKRRMPRWYGHDTNQYP